MSSLARHRPHLLVMSGESGTVGALSVLLDDYIDVHMATSVSEGFRCISAHQADVICQLDDIDAHVLCFLHTLRGALPSSRLVVVVPTRREAMLPELAVLRVDSLLTSPVSPVVVAEHIATLAALAGRADIARWLSNRYVSATLMYLSTNYADPLTIDRIASVVGTSGSHLVHVFRDVTGSTVRECLTRLRVVVTKNLLVTTDDKLEVIAERVGFCDASHLSRVFVQATGGQPGEFRRSHRRTAAPPMPRPVLDVARSESAASRRGA